jgi:plastocyanin
MFSLSKYLGGAAILVLATAGFAMPAKAGEAAVDQKDLMFTPDSVTIKAGDTVRFKDSDRIAHDITIDNPDGSSEDKGMDTYNVQIVVPFPKPGVYHVRCRIHPAMKMTITVQP